MRADKDSRRLINVGRNGRRIHSSLFINPSTFHLTVLMLRLSSDERVHTACEILQGIKDKVLECLEGRPVTVHLKGMDLMKGNRYDARVLYMRIREDQDDRLIRACQAIADAYKEAGLVSESERKFKLHATLMNTAYSRKNRSFDARKVLMKHRLIDWGQHSIEEVHLSQRFVYDENGYYHCCASIPFPVSQIA